MPFTPLIQKNQKNCHRSKLNNQNIFLNLWIPLSKSIDNVFVVKELRIIFIILQGKNILFDMVHEDFQLMGFLCFFFSYIMQKNRVALW